MPNWTKEQLLAINEDGNNIIVSAGAGSGKTAVLSERVKRKLTSGVHINSLLILTFTNAAAAEMKERIRKLITKDPTLKEELDLIDSSYITTFDSFSLSIVKKYHTRLNITKNIKITDEVLIDIEKNKILEAIFNDYYSSNNIKFNKLINNFCLKDDQELKDYILNIYKKIELKYDKEEYLNSYLDNYFSPEKLNEYNDLYYKIILEKKNLIKEKLDSLESYVDGEYFYKLLDSIKPLLDTKNYNETVTKLDLKMPSLPRNTEEEAKGIKKDISELIKDIKSLCIYENEAEIKEDILSTKDNISIIIDIVKSLDQKLKELKKDKSYFTFTDIATLAIKVVSENKDIKEELTNSFNEIMVDEYQDTSDIQEKFISLISKNNVYMVGDIKQSIYRFRNANPYIFKNKYDLYSKTDKGIKIDLNKNFRSREEVLSNINLLFNLFMDDEIGGANYRESHQMIFGNNMYNEEGKTNQDYNMDIITYLDDDKKISKDEHEAFIIGNDIKEKINYKYQVFDKETSTLRPINYSDFVILIDKSKSFNLYKKIFEYLQIPLTILKDESLSEKEDILVLRSLLKLLINIKNNTLNEEFKYNFISVSRSFLYKTSDEEIYNIFVNNSYEETSLYKKCQSLIDRIDITSPEEFIYELLEEFNYEEKVLTIGNVDSLLTRSEYFYNLVKSSSSSLYDFIAYLDTLFDKGYDLKFAVNNVSSNSCKIMTIHKSKGLEFPICYFAGFSNNFNLSELREKIIYDNNLGIIIPKVDEYYKDTALKYILKDRTKKEEISEKIRLLYVAMTRAKEKMIIVLKEQEEIEETLSFVSTFKRQKYNNFATIIKSIYSTVLPYVKKSNVICDKKYLQTNSDLLLDDLKINESLILKPLDIKTELVEEEHFSKENKNIITKEEKKLLEFGTKVHEALEIINFKDFSNDKYNFESLISTKIASFLNSKIIKDNINSQIYKEYEFIYKNNNTIKRGIIDLLIENENEFIIIDYKLKNIDDPLYDKQLLGYKDYIKTKTNKKVSCYLYSIMDSKFREVN